MPSPRKRTGLGARGWIVLGVLVFAIGGWIALNRQAITPSAEVSRTGLLGHIPPGAMLIATVDVAALRATPLGGELLGQGRTIAGLGEVSSICGSDPMDVVERMAVAIPDAGQDTGFGLFAGGAFVRDTLIGCAEKIVSRRGGRPVRTPAGRFLVLRDASLELSSAELAAADGGPVILGEPDYVRAAIGTESDASAANDEAHAALRALVPAGQLVATAVLSAEQRRALIDELNAQNMAESPFRAVTGAALSVSVTDTLSLALALRCDDEAACRGVATHLREAAASEAKTLPAKAIGLAALLEKVAVSQRGMAVHVSVSTPATEALTIVRRGLALRQMANAPAPSPPPREPIAEDDVGDAGVRIDAKPPASASAPTPGVGSP